MAIVSHTTLDERRSRQRCTLGNIVEKFREETKNNECAQKHHSILDADVYNQ